MMLLPSPMRFRVVGGAGSNATAADSGNTAAEEITARQSRQSGDRDNPPVPLHHRMSNQLFVRGYFFIAPTTTNNNKASLSVIAAAPQQGGRYVDAAMAHDIHTTELRRVRAYWFSASAGFA
jgi:hypothetical protein